MAMRRARQRLARVIVASRARALRWFAASLLATAAFDLLRTAAAQSSGGSFAITRSALGNASSSSGGAFALQSVVAQPVVGTVAAGAFVINGGVLVPPVAAPSGDAVFASGFE